MVTIVDRTEETKREIEKAESIKKIAETYFKGCSVEIDYNLGENIIICDPNTKKRVAIVHANLDSMTLKDPNYGRNAMRFGEAYEAVFLVKGEKKKGLLARIFDIYPEKDDFSIIYAFVHTE